jgi:hypothetical protein
MLGAPTAYGAGGGGVVGYRAPVTPKIQLQPPAGFQQVEPQFEVKVFIGDQELKGMVRTEIRGANRETVRVVRGGRA